MDKVSAAAAAGTTSFLYDANGDRRGYGTWNYEISVRQRIAQGLFATASLKYIGRDEQQVAGTNSQFSIASVRAALGWTKVC